MSLRVAGIAALALVSCGRARPERPAPLAVPVDVLADTARAGAARVRLAPTLPMPANDARVWVARVSPARPVPDEPPWPTAAPDTLAVPPGEAPMLALDEDLKPPIPRDRARLMLPAGVRPGRVELDVRVDETGGVSDAIWAGGSRDSALVEAATACALGMRFHPAEREGRRVAVWCRQQFDFTRR
jgi:TonB family protein